MDRQEIFQEVAAIVRAMDIGAASPVIHFDDMPFKAYGLNSLAQIQLAALVEDRFDIVIADTDAIGAYSALRLVDLIERKINNSGQVRISQQADASQMRRAEDSGVRRVEASQAQSSQTVGRARSSVP